MRALKAWACCILTSGIALFCGACRAASEPGSAWIAVEDLAAFIEEQRPVILDIRTPREYRGGHLPGAINIPLDRLEQGAHSIDRNRPLLIYCNTVNRVRVAVRLLNSLGFESVYIIDGGYQALRR